MEMRIFESIDMGNTWSHTFGQMQILGFTALNDKIYAATQNGALMYEGDVANWKSIYGGDALHDIGNDGKYIYAMTIGQQLLKTQNDGAIWENAQNGIICLLLYLAQEKLLFHPTKLSKDYTFIFNDEFEEVNLKTKDGIRLNGVHFKSKKKVGAVLFLHGNGGAINGWGQTSKLYIGEGYDVFYLDYQSYGKSEGEIKSEFALIKDAQLAYDYLKKHFEEDNIIISGTSIGTGIAAILAAENNPKKLILNSPYSSLSELIMEKVKIIPKPLIKYKLETDKYLNKIDCPIYLIHGDEDEIIPLSHSLKLKKLYGKIDLTILKGYGHNNITASELYLNKVVEILK